MFSALNLTNLVTVYPVTVSGLTDLITFMQGVFKPILIVVILALGLYLLIFANDKDSIKTAKRVLIIAVIAAIIVYGYEAIANLIIKIGEGGIST